MVKVYVDGSYNKDKDLTGWGYVVVDNDEVIDSKSGTLSSKDITSMYQVGGELMASIEGVEYCKSNLIKDVTIVYDYKGVECWVTGEWKCKKSITKSYSEYMKLMSSFVNYKFEKVKSHSGNKFNDMADRLSKIGCELS